MRSSSSSIFDRSRSQNSVNSASSRRHSKTLYWTERLHAALVLEEELLAAFLVEIGPAVPGLEMVRVEDLVAEEVQGEGFDEDGPEGFEEVQGEGPAAILGGVEEAEGGVEAVGVKEGDSFGVKEGGAEGDAGVDGVEGRAGGAAVDRKS